MNQKTNRRDLLKIVGASGAITASGAMTATSEASPSSGNYGDTRIVDVGVKFKLEETKHGLDENENLVGFQFDGNRIYSIDSRSERIVLKTPLPEHTKQQFKTANQLVSTDAISAPPVQVTSGEPVDFAVTEVDDNGYMLAGVSLTRPTGIPSVVVQEIDDQLRVLVEGSQDTLKPGFHRVFELATRTISVETERISLDTADGDEHEQQYLGPNMEYGETNVRATPKVIVTDHGTLPVVERRDLVE